MAIPRYAIACSTDSNESLASSMVEQLTQVVNEIEVSVSSPPRATPTHVGFGLELELDVPTSSGYCTELSLRVDLQEFALSSSNVTSSTPLPAYHVRSDLYYLKPDQTSGYLLGSEMSKNRLRSIETCLTWNSSGFEAEVALNDASFLGVIDYTSDVPGRLTWNSTQSNSGGADCINAFLNAYSKVNSNPRVENFLEGMEVLGLTSREEVDDNELGLYNEHQWSINANNFQTFVQSPSQYLQSFLTEPNDTWNLNKSSNGQKSLLEYIAKRTSIATYREESGRLDIRLPSMFEEFFSLHVNPDASIELSLDEIEFGGARIDGALEVSMPAPSQVGLSPPRLQSNLSILFGHIENVGTLSGTSLLASYDSIATQPFTIMLEIPNMTHTFDFVNASWNPLNQNFQLYPLQNADLELLVKSVLPTIVAEAFCTLILDNMVLSRLRGGGFVGELLESIGLAIQHSDQSYSSCNILLFAANPLQFIQNQYFDAQGMQVTRILATANVFLSLTGLSIEKTFVDDDEVLIDSLMLDIVQNSKASIGLYIRKNPSNASSIQMGVCTKQSLEFGRDDGSQYRVWGEVNFDVRMNLDSSLSFALGSSNCSLKIYPFSFLPPNASSVFGLNSTMEVNLGVSSSGLSLSLGVDLDGLGNAATLHLLPQLSGLQDFIRLLAGEAFESVLPIALTYLIRELHQVQVSSTTLGVILSYILYEVGLWELDTIELTDDSTTRKTNLADDLDFYTDSDPATTPSGQILTTEFRTLVSNPKEWLMGSNGITSGKLDEFVILGISELCTLLAVSGFSRVTAASTDYVQFQFQGTSTPMITLKIGKIVDLNSFGISVEVDETFGISSKNFNLAFEVSVLTTDGRNWSPASSLILKSTDSLISTPLTIKPIIDLSFDAVNGFSIGAASNYDAYGVFTDFWIQICPKPVTYGLPDLTQLALGAADEILRFLMSLDSVQSFLDDPLYGRENNSPNSPLLKEMSKLGPLLQHIGILTVGSVAQPGNKSLTWHTNDVDVNEYYIARLVSLTSAHDDWAPNEQGIIQHFAQNPILTLINGVLTRLSDVLSSNTSSSMKPNASPARFDYDISIVTQVVGSNTRYGLNLTLDTKIPFEVGGLAVDLLTQNQTQLNEWTMGTNKRTSSMNPGLTIYVAELDASNGVIPKFGIELGGVQLKLSSLSGKPLLENIMTLNNVTLNLALDVEFDDPTLIEFGGELLLDDFGIKLGGGSSDGGNGLAKGVLEGDGDGKDSVNPIFDLSISKYASADVDVRFVGQTQYKFPMNKSFGPVNVTEVTVAYEKDNSLPNQDRLKILVDADAVIAGLEGKCDDLGVNLPILNPLDFDDWKFEMKGFAVKVVQPGLSITGALNKDQGTVDFKESVHSQLNYPRPNEIIASSEQGYDWALQYVEYQGMCSIITPSFGINAIGAFARVPKPDGTGFISCFIIGGLNMPIGGPPFFFVNGLLGGLGLNRGLPMPDIDDVQNHAFMTMLGDPPMDALEDIKRDFPMEYGSYWFALGLKFSTFQVMNTRAVLFAKFGNGLTIGLMGLAEVDIPDAKARIAYVELGILAYYDSNQNVLWVQAQLTDNSFLFDQSCRLTGGFALVTWFNSGEFVLSLGGYAPQFNVPDYYPVVDRLGFVWTPTNALTVKGGTYFTICSRGAMVGGRLDASYEKGKLLATFVAGLDCLVEFDPFYYNAHLYISVSGKYGRFGATIGADLQIMGPRMHGTASLEFLFIKATVAFGNPDNPPSTIGLGKFMLKHVEQKEDYDEENDTLDIEDWLKGVGTYVPHSSSVVSGAVQEAEVPAQSSNQQPDPGTDTNPHLVSAEFELRILSKMPSESLDIVSSSNPPLEEGLDNQGNLRTVEQMYPTPIGAHIDSAVKYKIQLKNAPFTSFSTLQIQPTVSGFAPTLWNEAGNKDARYYIDGALVKGIADIIGNTNGDEISIDSVEPCEMYMHAPLVEFTSPTIYFEEIFDMEEFELPSFGVDVDDDEIFGAILGNQFVLDNQQTFFDEVEYVGVSKEVPDAINVDEVIG